MISILENFKVGAAGFALCIKMGESRHLIPTKIYRARFSSRETIGVINEEGKAAIYPAEFFHRVNVSSEVKSALEKLQIEPV